MGLDVYVGSLTRYHLHDWETVVQRAGRESGLSVEIRRPDAGEPEETDPATIRAAVVSWRERLNVALGENLPRPLDWDESPDSPYFTDKPTWDCYSSLLLWAAYSEHPDLTRPRHRVEDWAKDPAYVRSSAKGFRTAYPSLLGDVEVWFPSEFNFCFSSEYLTGHPMMFGSAVALAAELATLNERTWRADPETLARWRSDAAELDSPLQIGARFAFAIMKHLADAAVEHRLVAKLDY
jgi:hypothetical protein